MSFFDYNYFMTSQLSIKELLLIVRGMQQELIETRGKLEQMMKKNGEEFNKMYGAIETSQKNIDKMYGVIETNQKIIDANLKAIEDSKDDIKQMM